jgi:hypothetical protein
MLRLDRDDSYKQMKRAHSTLSIVLGLSMLLLAGCKAGETASNSAAKPAPADNSNKSAAIADRNTNSSKLGDASANAKPGAPPQLIGTYEAREIQDKGVVTLMSQIKTVISFSADGTFSRASLAEGKIYHSDSGLFRIEPPDKLVLTIQVSKKTIQTPPSQIRHTFSLSPDGDELKLTSEKKGSTAIFRRVSKPKTS